MILLNFAEMILFRFGIELAKSIRKHLTLFSPHPFTAQKLPILFFIYFDTQ